MISTNDADFQDRVDLINKLSCILMMTKQTQLYIWLCYFTISYHIFSIWNLNAMHWLPWYIFHINWILKGHIGDYSWPSVDWYDSITIWSSVVCRKHIHVLFETIERTIASYILFIMRFRYKSIFITKGGNVMISKVYYRLLNYAGQSDIGPSLPY